MSRMNRGQMIDQALQRVGNNSSSLKWQARIRLNRVLHDLHQGWDWPFLWTSLAFDIPPSGIFDFPTDTTFVKPEDDQALMVLNYHGQDMRHVVQEVDHRTFVSHRGLPSAYGGLPRFWTLNYATLQGACWPHPAERAAAAIRYKFLPPDILVDPQNDTGGEIYDTDIPSFPWDSFLIDAIGEWAMAYEVDPRRAEQITINEEMLRRLRGATWPERSFPSNIPLDPLFFSTPSWGRGG